MPRDMSVAGDLRISRLRVHDEDDDDDDEKQDIYKI